MNDQERTRERLSTLITKEGTRQKFVARQTKIVESDLSRFKNNTKVLKKDDLNRLILFLESKGY